MNHSFWLIIIFVAAIACNVTSRPQNESVQKYYRVYKTSKDPDLSVPIRYGYFESQGGVPSNVFRYRSKRETQPVEFVRIDIPRNKSRNGLIRSITESKPNLTESVRDSEEIRYVPVSVTTKNVKNWPGGHNGIESLDDLNLYNTYTSNVNSHVSPGQGHVVPYVTNNKPSIIIIEELTTRRPQYGYQPTTYGYSPIEVITYRPTVRPSYFGGSYHPTQPPLATVRPTIYIPTTTKKTTRPSCPDVSISGTIVNNNNADKEGCGDIKISIISNIHNTNNISSGSQATPQQDPQVTPVVSLDDPPDDDMSLFGEDPKGSRFETGNQIPPLPGVPLAVETKTVPLFLLAKQMQILPGSCSDTLLYTLRMVDDGRYLTSSSPATVAETTKVKFTVENEKKPDIEAIAIVARASSDHPIFASDLNSSKDSIEQMVESDIRTPPKLQEIMQGKVSNEGKRQQSNKEPAVDRIEANGKFELVDGSERSSSLPYVVSEGKASSKKEDLGVKGIAVPVIMEDAETVMLPAKKLQKVPELVKTGEKKTSNVKPLRVNPTTTPSSGLSTWILLSDNKESTTVLPKKTNKKEVSPKTDDKKIVTTTKKPGKIQTTTVKPVKEYKTEAPKIIVTRKGVISNKPKAENGNESMTALEAMVQNQKKNVPTTVRTMEEIYTTKAPLQKKPMTAKPTRINDRMDATEVNAAVTGKPPTIPPVLFLSTQDSTAVAVTDESGSSATTDPSVETTTKKKKSGSKKKKKNKNRRRKPSTELPVEQKEVVAKNPQPATGAQFYNFLSREIMPTVGIGLVGVLVTAGLAGLLGYNPFQSGNVPVRRTYDTPHGYSPYYPSDYNDGGQSEEMLFREVLSGMPEGSRYGLTNTENSYPESQIYSSQDQVYDAMKNQKVEKTEGFADKKDYEEEGGNFEQNYPQDYSAGYAYDAQDKTRENASKYPVYNREVSASYVYPEGTQPEKRLNDEYGSDAAAKMKVKYSEDTIERQPEALYRVAGGYESEYRPETTNTQSSWHRMGSALDYHRYGPEPGPRSLNFTKEELVAKKRTKRSADSVIQRIARKQMGIEPEKDIENEIDADEKVKETEVTTKSSLEMAELPTTKAVTPEDEDVTPSTEADYDVIETNPLPYNILETLKRLAQFKLKIGLSFLKSTTDAFSRYLDVIQKRVDESMSNTTLVYRTRSSGEGEEKVKSRRRRAVGESSKKQRSKKNEAKKEVLRPAGDRRKRKNKTWKKN